MGKTYIIRKDQHRSGLYFSPHFGKSTEIKKVIFSDRCWYDKINEDSLDINKLFGFSHGLHHNNSVRFGWIPDFSNRNKIQIWSYLYHKGIRKFDLICTVDCREVHQYKISIIDNRVFFAINDLEGNLLGELNYEFSTKFKWGYNLFPYFGGDNTSPKDLDIIII